MAEDTRSCCQLWGATVALWREGVKKGFWRAELLIYRRDQLREADMGQLNAIQASWS